MHNETNLAAKRDDKIKKQLIAWPMPRNDGSNIRYQPIPKNVPLPTPPRYEQDITDLDTGETTTRLIPEPLRKYFAALSAQFRRRHWAVQVVIHPKVVSEHTNGSEQVSGLFEIQDLRFGLKAKPEFLPYYRQVVQNIATMAEVEIFHTSEGFFAFHIKSGSGLPGNHGTGA